VRFPTLPPSLPPAFSAPSPLSRHLPICVAGGVCYHANGLPLGL
jgi:hypothetical protein